jgi:hypothetical protein
LDPVHGLLYTGALLQPSTSQTSCHYETPFIFIL